MTSVAKMALGLCISFIDVINVFAAKLVTRAVHQRIPKTLETVAQTALGEGRSGSGHRLQQCGSCQEGPFWLQNLDVWFAQAECQFQMKLISRQFD